MSITGHICHLCCREFDSSMALYMHHCVPHGDYPTQDCALCNGRGVYGIPGERCTFCHGTGKVRKPPAPVEREESSADTHGVREDGTCPGPENGCAAICDQHTACAFSADASGAQPPGELEHVGTVNGWSMSPSNHTVEWLRTMKAGEKLYAAAGVGEPK